MRFMRTLTGALFVTWGALAADLAGAQPLPENICTTHAIGPVTIDIPSVTIQPRFLLNGHPFPGAASGAALLTLWATHPSERFDGPQVVLGETQLARAPVRIVPGTYDVYYSWIGGTGIPRNQLTRVMQAVRLDRDRELVVDIPMVRISGVKLHNGGAFGFDGAATLSLRALDATGQVALGGAQPADFNVAIIPGRYAFEYDWAQGESFPANRHAVVREINLSASLKGLALNVPSIVQSFEFRHNGAAFPASAYDRGQIVLRRGQREEVFVGSSDEGSSVLRMIPATYNVHWRHQAGANTPRNANARFKQGLVVNGTPRIVNVPSVEIAGDVLVNGSAPPASAYENARLRLVGSTAGDSVVLGETRYRAYETRVVPGVYDLVYEHLAGAAILPSNPRAALVSDWDVATNPTRTIDIPVGVYQGDYLFNGSTPPASAYDRGRMWLQSGAADEDPVPMGYTDYGSFERRLLPRTYQAAFEHLVGSQLPRNAFTSFGPQRAVAKDAELTGNLHVKSGALTVSYAHNGATLVAGGDPIARVHLVRGRNYLRLFDSALPPHDMQVMPGTFDLYYEYRGGGGLPGNAFMKIGCWTLVP